MRLIAVTRIRNEDDIVEAFVRHHAALVDHLDCDEFIDPRPLGGSLHRVLETVPAQAPCVHTAVVNYHPTGLDDRSDLLVPRRLRWRDGCRCSG